jgi:hypothetical protein
VKAFQFNLERVLEWRRVQLLAAEEQLTQLQSQLHLLSQQEEKVLAAYRDSAEKLLSSATLAGGELQALAAFRERTNRLHQTLRARKARCEVLVAEQRQRLLKARKDHRILERLKEQRLKNWIYLNDREVESIAAETYLVNWVRTEAQRNDR